MLFSNEDILSYYSKGGGPGVCETPSLVTCYAALEVFSHACSLMIVREVMECVRF